MHPVLMLLSNNYSMSLQSLPRPPFIELETKARWLALLLLAIGLHVFEASLPSLGPWFKPGLANLITLLALVLMGPRAAISLAIARIVVGSFFIGTLFTPTFIIAMAGGLSASIVMIAGWYVLPRTGAFKATLISISLLGALTHMLAQFITVETLFIQQSALYYALPPLLLLSCISGWINGAMAEYICARLAHEKK